MATQPKFTFIICKILTFCPFLMGFSLRERLQRNPKLPPVIGNEPLKVLCGIYIESLGSFRSAEMSFDVDLYLYLSWQDPSLNHTDDKFVMLNDPKVRHYIWLPDLYFANSRTSRFHEVISPNLNLLIDQNGTIAYSTRITLSVACNLELSLYPMDSQQCAIQMLSYAYIEKQVKVRWFEIIDPTRYNPEIQLPEFQISNITNDYCDGTYNYAIMEHSHKRDKFSCLEAIIHLNRQIGYHVVQSFIPTGLIVMISWVSFWIDRRAVPARVTLSFTTLLSLSTLGNGLRFGLPQVAYAKAIDYWFGSCMIFVFLSLLEFAAVNSYMREAEKYERFANYYAKKNSLVRGVAPSKTPTPMLLPSPMPRREKAFFASSPGAAASALSEFNGWSSPKSTVDSDSSAPSIDASPSDENTAVRWSSAATVGDNNSFWLAINRRRPSPLSMRPKKEENNKETNKLSVVLPAITVARTESCKRVKAYNSLPLDGVPKTQHKPKIRAIRERNDGNPMASNHFLREGFIYSRKGLSIDVNSRWLFPVAFTVWNLLYWGYYLWYVQIRTTKQTEER